MNPDAESDIALVTAVELADSLAVTVPCVLGARILLNLREAADESLVVVDSSRAVRVLDVTDIRFSSHVIDSPVSA